MLLAMWRKCRALAWSVNSRSWAPAIFYLRGISPPELTLRHMYKGMVPFIMLEFVVLGAVAFFPGLALWLPSVVFGI